MKATVANSKKIKLQNDSFNFFSKLRVKPSNAFIFELNSRIETKVSIVFEEIDRKTIKIH